MSTKMRIGKVLLKLAAAAVCGVSTVLLAAGVAVAAPAEHAPKSTFVDPQFSAFLSGACGYPVVVTDTESDTFVDNGTVSIISIHITATVVGNGHSIELRTNGPLIQTPQNQTNEGLIIQVRSSDGRRLTQYAGQMRTLDDGTNVFHPAFPEFNLCDFLD